MRRIAVLLALLFVVVLQAAAYAADHWDRIADTKAPIPDKPQSAAGALMVVVTTIILAWLIIHFLGTGKPCALLVAVGSVATMILVGEYGLIFVFTTVFARGVAQFGFVAIVNIVILVVMLVSAAPCCLNKKVSVADALKIIIVPALVPVLYGVLRHGLLR